MAINKHALENWLCPKCGNAFKDISYTTCGMCGQNVVWVKSSTSSVTRERSYGVCLPGEENEARPILEKKQDEKEVRHYFMLIIVTFLFVLFWDHFRDHFR